MEAEFTFTQTVVNLLIGHNNKQTKCIKTLVTY